MRWLLVVSLLFSLGCVETRPTCEVVCSNEVRCGFRPDTASCVSMCNARIATSTMDCRVATDAYHRCWSVQNSCPRSVSGAAPGCTGEFNDQALACVPGPMPLLQSGGI